MSKLTNADFGALLSSTSSTKIAGKRNRFAGEDDKKHARKQKFLNLQKQQKKKGKTDTATSVDDETFRNAPPPASETFVDRAADRRGAAEDYEKIAKEYEDFQGQSIEHSQYMGGDRKTTHLVKGLDRVLLNEERELTARNAQKHAQKPKPNLETVSKRPVMIRNPMAQRLNNRMFEELCPQNLRFHQNLQSLQTHILNGKTLETNSKFVSGQLRYAFDIQMRMVGEDVPRSVFEARTSRFPTSSKIRDRRGPTCPISTKLAEEMKDLTEWHAENRRRKRNERIPRRPAAIAAEQARLRHSQGTITPSSGIAMGSVGAGRTKEFKGEVDNIFDDVDGNFSAEDVVATATQQISNSKQRSSYFDDAGTQASGAAISRILDDANDVETHSKTKSANDGKPTNRSDAEGGVAHRITELENVDDNDLSSQLTKIVNDDENKETKKAKRLDELMADDDDPYFECYPPNLDSILCEEMDDEHDDIFTKLRRGQMDDPTDVAEGNNKRRKNRNRGGDKDNSKDKEEKPKLSQEAKAQRDWQILEKTINDKKTKGQSLGAVQSTMSYKVTSYRPTIK
eukprot:Selendium_serpulae@DN5699_c0_g1_i1.p1